MRRFVCTVVGFLVVVGAGAPRAAAAQGWDAAGGYSFMHDSDVGRSFGAGWFAALGVDVNKWLGAAGDVSANYKTIEIRDIVPNGELKLRVHFVGAGPRFIAHTAKAHPFAQVLLGAARASGNVAGQGGSDSAFAWQPGGGVDVDLSRNVGLRFAANGRFIHSDGDTTKEFQVEVGVVYRKKK